MTQQQWIEEFARILADKLDEPVESFHLNTAVACYEWYTEFEMTPEEAVQEELYCWGP